MAINWLPEISKKNYFINILGLRNYSAYLISEMYQLPF